MQQSVSGVADWNIACYSPFRNGTVRDQPIDAYHAIALRHPQSITHRLMLTNEIVISQRMRAPLECNSSAWPLAAKRAESNSRTRHERFQQGSRRAGTHSARAICRRRDEVPRNGLLAAGLRAEGYRCHRDVSNHAASG